MAPFRDDDDAATRRRQGGAGPLRSTHGHDFFDEDDDDEQHPQPRGNVARNLHAMEFGPEEDDEHDDDTSEFRSLYGNGGHPPRLEPREQIRRTLLSGGLVLAGCAAFVLVTVAFKGRQQQQTGGAGGGGADVGGGGGGDDKDSSFGPGSPALEPIVGGDGNGKAGGDGNGKAGGGGAGGGRFHVSPSTVAEFEKWAEGLYESTGLNDYKGGEPPVDWDLLGHPKRREDRFPSPEERVKYCMGRFYDRPTGEEGDGDEEGGEGEGGGGEVVDAWGADFLRDTYLLQRTTRKFSISSSFVVNLYDFNTTLLEKCDREENTVLHTYCRDFVDFAILHSDMSAGAIQHMGDSLPKSSPSKKVIGVGGQKGGYPVLNKVRTYCDVPPDRLAKYPDFWTAKDRSPRCDRRDKIDTILWPLNRHRHFTPAALIGPDDVPWDDKVPKAIWRGGTNDALSDRKYALVSLHENSTAVDAKFAERNNKRGRHGDKTEGIPEKWLSGFLSKEEQLRHKYLISIEGNDVSSGLKWMLFSNSVVLLPPTTFESWAMEGLLEPYVHYIPIKSDMTDVESQIEWAESNPSDAKRIAQRSTLFIYDLLFHPDATRDERAALKGIAERYEENFGYLADVAEKHLRGDISWENHPERREDRFPGVEERVRYYMGRWYGDDGDDDGDEAEAVSMARREGKKTRDTLPPALADLDDLPTMKAPFVASGEALEDCASSALLEGGKKDRAGPDPHDAHTLLLAKHCASSLPYFDERLVHDIVSTRHPDEDPSFKLAPEDEDLGNAPNKWFKRILVDDSAKVLRFGERVHPREEEEGDDAVPVFAGTRRATTMPSERDVRGGGGGGGGGPSSSSTILWRFGSGGYDLVRSGLIERADATFESKEARAVWRGGFGTEDWDGVSDEFESRLSLVRRSSTADEEKDGGEGKSKIDARFVLSGGGGEAGAPPLPEGTLTMAEPRGEKERSNYLRRVLSFRYVVCTEDDYRPNGDLKWMLLSRSVVLMPLKRRFASWLMEDAFLEPYVHFVPIKADYSDVEEQIDWCEEHPSEAERIAERATLYVHDMLFHRRSAKEDNEVLIRIMERYGERLGG